MTPSRSTALQLVLRDPVAMTCIALVTGMLLAALVGPVFTGYGYEQTSELQFQAPGAAHWFGTDLHGRDVLTRVLFGARISLVVGLVGTLVSLTVGVCYGMISGYLGGRADNLMMRFVDILYSLPRIVIAAVMITALDKWTRGVFGRFGLETFQNNTRIILLFVGLGAVQWLTMARIVRGQVLSLKEQAFVLAAKALGARRRRILFLHLLPNLTGIIIVYLTLTIPVMILTESFLSFLGLGIQPPQASWGTLISDGASVINPVRMYWWLLVFPGMAMALTLLALNLLGDRLRDICDPRMQRR